MNEAKRNEESLFPKDLKILHYVQNDGGVNFYIDSKYNSFDFFCGISEIYGINPKSI